MLTRRHFIGSTAAAGAALATGLRPAAAQKRLIVDSQIHLWKAESADYKWLPGVKPQIPEPFTVERAIKLMDEAGVDRAVIIPPGVTRDRNDYEIEVAKRYPNRFAIMGSFPLDNANNAGRLATWKNQHMLGVRHAFNDPKSIAQLKDGSIDWFWPAAEKAQVPVMVLAFGMTNLFEPIAAKHPGLTLIIDHIGVNTAIAKAGRTAEVVGHAVALAKYPNVSVKLSNLPNASLEPYPFKDLDEHIKRLYDAYGPQRCHWGTDVTNGLNRVGWKQRLTHFTEEIKFIPERDKDQVLGRSILQKLNWKV